MTVSIARQVDESSLIEIKLHLTERALRATKRGQCERAVFVGPLRYAVVHAVLEYHAVERLLDSDDPETVCATICDTIGADSLGFVSIEEMVAATEQPRSELCTACFSGEYPLGLPAGNSNADAVRTLLGTE